MRFTPWILLLAGCATPDPRPAPAPARDRSAAAAHADPLIERATTALRAGDLAGARAMLEHERWFAGQRDTAALLLAGCLLAERRHADAIDVLRAYLVKTARLKHPGDRIAVHLLRHHATGGGERARDAREACYFGLYAWGALDEPDTARADLEWARREAPPAEKALVALVEIP